MSDVEEFLEHYGVKGMKWGVRRDRRSARRAAQSKLPRAEDLSDDDLRRAINRMELEQRYTNLTKSRSKKAGAEFVKSVGTNVVKTAVTSAASYQVGKVMKKAKLKD